MGKDGEHRTDCWKMPSRHLLNELFWQEVDVVLARRGFREPRGVEGPGGNVLDGLVWECDDGDDKADACDRPSKTCSSQCSRDVRVLGSPLLDALGSLGIDATRAGSRVPLFGDDWQLRSSLGCQPRSYESALLVTWSVLGSPPFRTFHHCPVTRDR